MKSRAWISIRRKIVMARRERDHTLDVLKAWPHVIKQPEPTQVKPKEPEPEHKDRFELIEID